MGTLYDLDNLAANWYRNVANIAADPTQVDWLSNLINTKGVNAAYSQFLNPVSPTAGTRTQSANWNPNLTLEDASRAFSYTAPRTDGQSGSLVATDINNRSYYDTSTAIRPFSGTQIELGGDTRSPRISAYDIPAPYTPGSPTDGMTDVQRSVYNANLSRVNSGSVNPVNSNLPNYMTLEGLSEWWNDTAQPWITGQFNNWNTNNTPTTATNTTPTQNTQQSLSTLYPRVNWGNYQSTDRGSRYFNPTSGNYQGLGNTITTGI